MTACVFAWQVRDTQRGPGQSGYRIVVSGPDDIGHDRVGLGPGGLGQPGLRGLRRAATSADSRYRWTVATADGAGRWSGPVRRRCSPRGCAPADWTAQWLRPGPGRARRGGVHLPPTDARRCPAAPIAYATAYVAACPQVPAVGERRPGSTPARASASPTSSTTRRPTSPAALVRRAGPTPSASCTTGTGRARVARRRLRGCWSRWGSTTPTARRHPRHPTGAGGPGGRNGCRPPSATTTSATSSNGSTAALHPTGWSHAGLRRPRLDAGRRARPGGHRAVHPPLRPADPDQRAPGAPGVGADPAHRLGGGRLRQGLRRSAHRVVPPRDRTDTTVPMHVGYTLDPDGSVSTTHNTQGTDLSLLVHPALGGPDVRPLLATSGSATCRSTTRASPSAADQVALVARHATMPERPTATFRRPSRCSTPCGRCAPIPALYTSQEQFIDTPTREKGQFLLGRAPTSPRR